MKLFLTSSGLEKENEEQFRDLLGRDTQGIKVAFVPTAANGELGQFVAKILTENLPDWFVKDLHYLKKLGAEVSFINLEDLNENNVVETFAPFDVIYMYGGNTFYLMHYINQSGFKRHARQILQNKLYVGVSAGSIVAGPDMSLADWKGGDKNDIGLTDTSGLGLINFTIQPHWKGQTFEEAETYPYEVRYLKDGEVILV